MILFTLRPSNIYIPRLYVMEIHLLIWGHWLEGGGAVEMLPRMEVLVDSIVPLFTWPTSTGR